MWLRLVCAEAKHTRCVKVRAFAFKEGKCWGDLLSATQACYFRAVQTLARVRRRARNTLALQTNIARE